MSDITTSNINGITLKVMKDVEEEPLLKQQQHRPPQQPSLLDVKDLGSKTVLIIFYYACCSSLMLVINKLAIYHIPAPTFLLFIQLVSSVVAVLIGDWAGWLIADKLEWGKALKFIWVVVG